MACMHTDNFHEYISYMISVWDLIHRIQRKSLQTLTTQSEGKLWTKLAWYTMQVWSRLESLLFDSKLAG